MKRFAGFTLTAGKTYYLVTTGDDATQFGAFVSTISGPGTFSLVS